MQVSFTSLTTTTQYTNEWIDNTATPDYEYFENISVLNVNYFSNQATKSEVLNIVSGLELGPVSSVKLRSCPLWVEPLDTMFSAMGINTANIDSLQLSYLSRQVILSSDWLTQNCTNL